MPQLKLHEFGDVETEYTRWQAAGKVYYEGFDYITLKPERYSSEHFKKNKKGMVYDRQKDKRKTVYADIEILVKEFTEKHIIPTFAELLSKFGDSPIRMGSISYHPKTKQYYSHKTHEDGIKVKLEYGKRIFSFFRRHPETRMEWWNYLKHARGHLKYHKPKEIDREEQFDKLKKAVKVLFNHYFINTPDYRIPRDRTRFHHSIKRNKYWCYFNSIEVLTDRFEDIEVDESELEDCNPNVIYFRIEEDEEIDVIELNTPIYGWMEFVDEIGDWKIHELEGGSKQ